MLLPHRQTFLRAVTYSEVNSHGPLPPTTFQRYLCDKHKTAEGNKHCRRQSMNWRQNARRLPPTGATPSPYPLTRLPVGAYLLVYSILFISPTWWGNKHNRITQNTVLVVLVSPS